MKVYRMASLCKTPPLLFSFFFKNNSILSKCKTHFYSPKNPRIYVQFRSTYCFPMKKETNLCTTSAHLQDSKSPVKVSNKAQKKARRDLPENVLKNNLEQCSKRSDLKEALRLYDEARANSVPLNVHHYNILLYLCTVGSNRGGENCSAEGILEVGLEKGFEIFKQMGLDSVVPNEATFTNAARLAAAKEDPEMAFELVKQMKSAGIIPRLRSYEPALFGFCKKMEAGKAYEVDAHMIENGLLAEEPELLALLKLSSEDNRPEKVYEMMHRMRATVRQVSEETAEVVEDWFRSKNAAEVGKEKWDEQKVKEGVINGGGGWHGQGWLGKGKWRVARTGINQIGTCLCCGEKLVSIDIDPKETENFAKSLSKLACEKEAKTNFVQFQV